MDLSKTGILASIDTMSGPEGGAFARGVERLGYSVLWVPETFGRDPFVMATHMLNATENIIGWGDEQRLRELIEDYRRAGAGHVYLIPLRADGGRLPDMRVAGALAPK